MSKAIEQAVDALLEQDFSAVDYGDEGPDANDIYWAKEFKEDWYKGGVWSNGQWFTFRRLDDALMNWTRVMEASMSRGFLKAVRGLFAYDPSAQATIDHMISRGAYE